MAALTDDISQLKYHIDTFVYIIYKKKAHISLKQAAKKGTMKNASSPVLKAADIQVYNAFEPIMTSKKEDRNKYLNDPETKREYREGFVQLISNFSKQKDTYSKIYPEIYTSNGEVNIEALSKMVRAVSNEWVYLTNNINADKGDIAFLRKATNFNLGSYILTKPADRRRIIQISEDKNYSRDVDTYKTFSPEIKGVYGMSLDAYLNNQAQREKYHKLYEDYKKALATKKGTPLEKVTDDECRKSIEGVFKDWVSVIKSADLLGAGMQLAGNMPIAKYALMTPEQQKTLKDNIQSKLSAASNQATIAGAAKK